MIKKTVSLLFLLILCLSASGCWNYVMLNEITIVVGMAIDMNESGDKYKIAFEISDIKTSLKNETAVGHIIESEGESIFDAIRNANKELSKKLYFSHMAIVVISEKIARQQGVAFIINWLLRDNETRETVNLLISQEDTAKAILAPDEKIKAIISYNIRDVIKKDNDTAGNTTNATISNVYNSLQRQGIAAVMPAIRLKKTDDKQNPELNGVAVFNEDKVIGFMDPYNLRIFLLLINKLQGGDLTFAVDSEKPNITLEIENNHTKLVYHHENGSGRLTVDNKMKVFINDLQTDYDLMDKKQMEKLKKLLEEALSRRYTETIHTIQTEYGTDILGVGYSIYKKDYKLWHELSENWENIFQNIEVEVKCSINIKNSGFIK